MKEKKNIGLLFAFCFVLIGYSWIMDDNEDRKKFEELIKKDSLVNKTCKLKEINGLRGSRNHLTLELNIQCEEGSFSFKYLPRDFKILLENNTKDMINDNVKVSFYKNTKCIKELIYHPLNVNKKYRYLTSNCFKIE